MKNRYTKRIFTFLLALALLLGLCPVAPVAQAETMSTEVCPCCNKAFSKISWTKYDKWDNLFGGVNFSKAGHYKIDAAFTMKKEFTISSNVTIDFCGYKLQAKSGSRGFTVADGGSLTLINTGGDNGRLEGHNTSSEGGAIKVEAGGTLNILSGRIIGTTMSYAGGAIYNEGTVNMAGGKVDSGKITGKHGGNIYNAGEFNMYGGTLESGTTTKYGGNVYNTGTFSLYGGTVDGGTGTGGGNIYNLGTLEIRGGAVTGGTVTGDNGYGGNISNSGTLNIYDGTISDGTSEDHGGNIFCTKSAINIYGGTISGGTVTGGTTSDGTAFAGGGGNIYITGQAGVLKVFGGTISGGQNTNEASPGAANIMINSGAQMYLYGGTVSTDSPNKGGNLNITSYATLEDQTKQYSGVYILGGTLTNTTDSGLDFFRGSINNPLEIYNCRYNGSQDIIDFIAQCCCKVSDENGITVWNAGYRDGTCLHCLYAQAAVKDLVTPVTGGHNYEAIGNNTYACTGCGLTQVFEEVAATINGELFATLAEALAAANPGDTLILMQDAAVTEVAVGGYTLDLNGHTLTADAFTSATSGVVIDSSKTNTGKLDCADVTLAENNENLPITYDNNIRFCPVGFTQWIEPTDVNTTKVKFYFTQRDKETVLDDAIKAGNTELDVQLYLSWIGSDGTKKEKVVSFGTELIQKYAEKWNGRVFVATINGISGITDLQVAYRVTSTATTAGVTLSASTIKSSGYIHENLTWDAINSYPIKTENMTVEEMRDLCVDFMVFNKTYLWTPSVSVDYIRNSAGTHDAMSQGTIYGGLPYVGVATGNPYRMMDYINPETGLLDMQKALPLLGTKDRLAYTDLKYFGSQCSICVYWAWGRVMNSTNYRWTSSAVPYNGFVILGDVQIPEITGWNGTYGTDECVAENGEQVLFGGYAQLQKADGLVYYTTAGHLIMAHSDPVVVYNEDGTINGDESYIYISDQAQKWEEATNESGDTYQRKSSVAAKKTFTQLFNNNYIPFTFEEFLGTDPIEKTEVGLKKGSTYLINGTISEDDRSFQATKTKDQLTWSQLMDCSITSNYGVVDAYVIVKDSRGNQLYKHAVRTETAGNKNLAMEEEGAMVTVWETKALKSGKTYSAQIVVQLSTGERPTIFNGQLTMGSDA